MKEYKVTLRRGFFDEKVIYTEAESAAAIQKQLEKEFAYELEFEGLVVKNIEAV